MPAKSKGPERGICFPKDSKGGRSTSDAGKAVIAAALRGAKTDEAMRMADACEKERDWRFKYNKHFRNLVKVSPVRNYCIATFFVFFPDIFFMIKILTSFLPKFIK